MMRSVANLKRIRTHAVVLSGAAALLALFTFGWSPGAGAAGEDPADLALTKSDSPDPVTEGAVLTYTIAVENLGPDEVTNVVVTDDLPSQVDDISASVPGGTCDVKGKKVTCTLPSIANGATAKFTVLAHPKKTGTLQNTAEVTSDVTDPVEANNSDTVPTAVTAAGGGATCRQKAATIVGTPGDDAGANGIVGTDKRDVIVAGDGNDLVQSGAGNDIVCGGRGHDVVQAGDGNDFVKGGRAGDELVGQSGDDDLKGNRGRDRLRGGTGNDLLAGGKGGDRCAGGSGRDVERSC
jgi:uncharacterized repeat protein (TIGR01451 family)